MWPDWAVGGASVDLRACWRALVLREASLQFVEFVKCLEEALVCADAACFCPRACPLGSLTAHRCVKLQLASLQDVRWKRRQFVFFATLQLQILRCLGESPDGFLIMELVLRLEPFLPPPVPCLILPPFCRGGLARG